MRVILAILLISNLVWAVDAATTKANREAAALVAPVPPDNYPRAQEKRKPATKKMGGRRGKIQKKPASIHE
ncbi:MAG: hypothetical protein HYR96_09355 [Deltaproteobacteria bacterium]|nr:hypothetical protein [Deltaproteobacteria bacterium]MBI3296162.1 hypothetical protein [Deltaproteobacteria bacterium]